MEKETNEPAVLEPLSAPLSKNARKKAVKAERYAVFKLERRAREKVAKKEKKRVAAEKRASGELDADADVSRRKKRARLDCGWKGRVIVDLGFDALMSEKEVSSLTSQLAYTHSANRSAGFPFSILFTGINGRTFERMQKTNDGGHKRWAKTEWWTDGYEKLWSKKSQTIEGMESENENEETQTTEADKESIIYLTADSEHELAELNEDETYVIGGIVDHNRYKNLCENKAVEQGVRTARLPIGTFLADLPTRKVLTVNQVFEILVKWVETRNWEQALYSVIPKRKFHQKGREKEADLDQPENELVED